MTRLLTDLQPTTWTKNGPYSIRRYQSTDHARIVDVCRNVYDGTDYIPRMIQHLFELHGTRVLVSQTGSSAVDGIVCGQKRGSSYFVFGLRVAEEVRGQGRATALMEAICQHCAEFGAVQTVSSATVPQNTAAVRIFNSMGFQHTHTVDQWPSWDALAHYEQVVQWAGDGVRPDPQVLQQQPNMLDVLGMRDTLAQCSSGAGVDFGDWTQCSSLNHLHEAVTSIRARQQQSMQQGPPVPLLDHLPWVYEAFPLDADWTKQRLAQQQIWLLPSKQLQHSSSVSSGSSCGNGSFITIGSSTDMAGCDHEDASPGDSLEVSAGQHQHWQQYAAVVVIDFSQEMRRYCAGVMTVEDAYIAPALEFVASQLPHCVYFFDRGSRHSSGMPEPDVILPAVMTTAGTLPCFIVYTCQSDRHSGCNSS